MSERATWRRGRYLDLPQYDRMSKEWKDRARRREKTMIFSSFLDSDQGKSRLLVAVVEASHPSFEVNGPLIEAAPKMLEALEAFMEADADCSQDGSPAEYVCIGCGTSREHSEGCPVLMGKAALAQAKGES